MFVSTFAVLNSTNLTCEENPLTLLGNKLEDGVLGLLQGMVSMSPREPPPHPQRTFENRESGSCRNGSLSTLPTGFHASSSVWTTSTSDCPGHTLFGCQGPQDNTSAPFPGILSITFWIVFPLKSLSVLYMMTHRFHVSFCSKPTLVIPHTSS